MTISTRWMDLAACQGTDLDMVPTETSGAAVLPQRRLCAGCPVRRECLDYATAVQRQQHVRLDGLWGGLFPDDRRRLATGLREARCARCRTFYVGRADTDSCDSCSRGSLMKAVEEHGDRLRELVEQGMFVVEAASQLGLSREMATIWAAKNITRPATWSSSRCGTPTGRRWHRKELAGAGQDGDLSHLTCACAPSERTGKKKNGESRNTGLSMAA